MRTSTLRFLIILAVCFTTAAWFVSQREKANHSAGDAGLYAPELSSRLADISRVEIEAAGEERFSLQRQGESWVIPSKANYNADTSALRKLLRTLATTEVLEAKTAKPELHERLKLTAINEANDTTIEVLAFAGDEPVFGTLLGKTGQGGQYVRRSNDNQSWLIADALRPGRTAADWLDKALIDIKRADLRSVKVKPADGREWSLQRSGDSTTDFSLEPRAAGDRDRNGANSNRLLSALSGLRILDVREANDEDGKSAWQTLIFERFDGLEVTAKIRQSETKYWLQLQATVSALPAEAASEAEDPKPDPAATSQLVATINEQAHNRVFEISSYPGFGLAMSYDDMLKEEGDPS